MRYLLAGLKERVAEQRLGHQPLFRALDFRPGSAARRILWDLLSSLKPHVPFSWSSPLFLIYVCGQSTRRGASPTPAGCRGASLQPRWLPLSPPGPSPLVPPRAAIRGAGHAELPGTRLFCARLTPRGVGGPVRRDSGLWPGCASQSMWLRNCRLGAGLASAALPWLEPLSERAGLLQNFPLSLKRTAAAGAWAGFCHLCFVLLRTGTCRGIGCFCPLFIR